MPKPPDPLGRNPFIASPRTPGPLGVNDAADPDTPDWFLGDTPTPLGIGDWADPNAEEAGPLLLAYAGHDDAAASPPPPTPAEYVPDLGTTRETIEAYDQAFEGPKGALLKQRIQDAATKLDLNPGLIAASLLAEHKASSYTKRSGAVAGVDIGTDDWETAKRDMQRKVPLAATVKPTGFEAFENEEHRIIPNVPFFKAEDAVLASAIYLKYSELKLRDVLQEMGGSFERLPVEYQFALTRFGMNAGHGRMRKRVGELLGVIKKNGSYVPNGKGKDFLQYKPWKLKLGVEQYTRKKPQRAATAHTAQAIHISQKIFGITPSGGGDSLLFVR